MLGSALNSLGDHICLSHTKNKNKIKNTFFFLVHFSIGNLITLHKYIFKRFMEHKRVRKVNTVTFDYLLDLITVSVRAKVMRKVLFKDVPF